MKFCPTLLTEFRSSLHSFHLLLHFHYLLTGKPKEKVISHIEVAKAIDKSVIRIEDSIMETLSHTPPELAADIYNTGIYLAGGGALLRGLDERLSKKMSWNI